MKASQPMAMAINGYQKSWRTRIILDLPTSAPHHCVQTVIIDLYLVGTLIDGPNSLFSRTSFSIARGQIEHQRTFFLC